MMFQNKILKIKESPAIIAHIGNLQQIISRMASNSMNTKILISTITTFIITILLSSDLYDKYWWISIIIIIYGVLIDAYYLALERIFRKEYNTFIDNINLNYDKFDFKSIYVIKGKNQNCEGERFFKTIRAIGSISIFPYYSTIFIVVMVLKFL